MQLNIGISACLLGESCRYNGDHARDRFVTDILSKYVSFIPYCPEAILGTPRAAIRLVEEGNILKVLTTKDQIDLTTTVKQSSQSAVDHFASHDLSGFILKSKSPTCGLERVKIYSKENVNGEKKGMGIFASEIKKRYPYLPVEEEGRLQDPWLKENFMMQVYAYADMQSLLKTATSLQELIVFHTNYKYLIYAKSQQSYKTLGAIVANHHKKSFQEIMTSYEVAFYEAISQKSTRTNNYNIMQHLYGYFKTKVSDGEKQELLVAMKEYKEGILPMIVIIKMLRLYIQKFDVSYLKSQVYLNPYPAELGLRSDVRSYK
ncbi:MAG: DUF523 and DUF1722 domain-containing protein [Epsilonproteobacteria bacterium]|nr:DUF523 and DUF1722 domain-containing protein [Campylobacterota bacterium]